MSLFEVYSVCLLCVSLRCMCVFVFVPTLCMQYNTIMCCWNCTRFVPLFIGTSGQANNHCVSRENFPGTNKHTNSGSSFSLHILWRPAAGDKAQEYRGIITNRQWGAAPTTGCQRRKHLQGGVGGVERWRLLIGIMNLMSQIVDLYTLIYPLPGRTYGSPPELWRRSRWCQGLEVEHAALEPNWPASCHHQLDRQTQTVSVLSEPGRG